MAQFAVPRPPLPPNALAASQKPTVNGHPNGGSWRGSTQRIQIIDDEKQFTSVFCFRIIQLILICHAFCRSDLSTQVEQWGLRDAGFDYNIVAVFGSQSTGKSM